MVPGTRPEALFWTHCPWDFFPDQQTHIPASLEASVDRREGTRPGLGVAGADARALPSSGDLGRAGTVPPGTEGPSLCPGGCPRQPEHTRPRKPHGRAPRPLTLPSVTSRGHTLLPRPQKAPGLRPPDTRIENSSHNAQRESGKRSTHCLLPDKACLAARGCWGTLERGRERAVCHRAPPRKVLRHVRPSGRTRARSPRCRPACSEGGSCGTTVEAQTRFRRTRNALKTSGGEAVGSLDQSRPRRPPDSQR